MRVFWAIVLVLLVAGGAAAFLSKPGSREVPKSEPVQSNVPDSPAPAQPAAPVPPTPPAAAEKPAVDFNADLAKAIGEATGSNASTSPEAAVTAGAGVPFELPGNDAFPPEKLIPSKAVKVGGEIVIEGKYRVKGSGTAADPYIVPFELLMSAADVFDPRKGLSKMPQRVAFLHEKHVTLPGYVAFPISSTDPKEMLVMFNQWDGCCIGVPPTAYDAVETKLAKPVEGDDKFITFGSTTGVLKVDPYVDNGWLLGLYIMEGATLSEGKHEPVSPKQMPPDDN